MKKTYYEQYANFEKYHWWFEGRKRLLEMLLSNFIGKVHCQKILDVGIGPGTMVSLLKHYGRLVSIERSADALKTVQKTDSPLIIQGDGLYLPFRDDSFRIITALDVIEHIEDDYKAVSEFWRVCQKEGYLCIMVPAFNFLWGKQDIISEHKRRYTLKQIKRLLEETGFRIVKISYFNFLFFLPITAIRMLSYLFLRPDREKYFSSDFEMTPPGILNKIFTWLFGLESIWLRKRNFPFGISIVCIAQKS